MSHRNWKSSNNARRRGGSDSVVGSVYTSSSSSTVSVSNRTVASMQASTSEQALLEEHSYPKSQTEGFAVHTSNQSTTSNGINSNFDVHHMNDFSTNLNSNGSVSGMSKASSIDTYDFAFKLSPSQNTVPSKLNGSGSRREKTSSLSVNTMPTVDETNPNGESFIDNFLSGGELENSASNNKFDNFSRSNAYNKGTQLLSLLFERLKFISLKVSKAVQQKQGKHHAEDYQSSYKYTKHRSRYFSSQTRQYILSGLKFLLFISLITILMLSLKLANMNQPELLSPQSSRPQTLKQRLIRRKSYPRYDNIAGQIDFPLPVNTGAMNGLEDSGKGNIHASSNLSSEKETDDIDQQQMQYKQKPEMTFKHVGARLPAPFLNLADIDEVSSQKGHDFPFFWHIPRSGGTMMNDILGSCLKLSLASDAGGRNGHDHDEELQILNLGAAQYVNVDMSTLEGIERAKKLNLASSHKADVMISSRVFEASIVFTPLDHGRLFTLFRHPIERAVSLFYYTQDMIWRRGNVKDLMDISIEEYFKGGMGDDNWMTRFLANAKNKVLTDDDLDVAKEVLRRKCVIGLLSEKGESITRFMKYFGWDKLIRGEKEQDCIDKMLDYAWPQKHRHEEVEEGSDIWDLIVKKNEYDLKLFDYAKTLFFAQSKLFAR